MLKSILWGYSDVYMPVNGTITISNTEAAAAPNNTKNAINKKCAPFTGCINEINNIQIDHVKGTDVVISMYNVIQYSDNYSKTSVSYSNTIEMNHF